MDSMDATGNGLLLHEIQSFLTKNVQLPQSSGKAHGFVAFYRFWTAPLCQICQPDQEQLQKFRCSTSMGPERQ